MSNLSTMDICSRTENDSHVPKGLYHRHIMYTRMYIHCNQHSTAAMLSWVGAIQVACAGLCKCTQITSDTVSTAGAKTLEWLSRTGGVLVSGLPSPECRSHPPLWELRSLFHTQQTWQWSPGSGRSCPECRDECSRSQKGEHNMVVQLSVAGCNHSSTLHDRKW